jgi:hypothetical protein
MRRLLLSLSLLLLAVPTASAKGVIAAKVCGADGCRVTHDRAATGGLAEGGDPTDPPAAAARFFRVRLTVGDEAGTPAAGFWTHYVPSAGLIRGADGTWMPVGPAYARSFARVSRGLHAFPAARLAQTIAGDAPARHFTAQVSSVVEPPTRETDGDGIPGWVLAAAAGGLLLLAGLGAAAGLDRRTGHGEDRLSTSH